jgi:hypothetical protein
MASNMGASVDLCLRRGFNGKGEGIESLAKNIQANFG